MVDVLQGSNPGPPDQWVDSMNLAGFESVEPANMDDAEYLDNTEYQAQSGFEIAFQYDPEGASMGEMDPDVVLDSEDGGGSSEVFDSKFVEDIGLAEQVMATGKFNFQEARVPVRSNWNTELLATLLQDYSDKQVAEFIQFGWPIDRDDSVPLPEITGRNHKGAIFFAEEIDRHMEKEISLNAVAGPFHSPPMDGFCCSPLNSRPKRLSSQRRVIYDLSWEPHGPSINAGISKHQYLGEPVRLRYPTVHTLIKRIKSLKLQSAELVLLYKRDWARAFSQLPLDPACYWYVGFVWQGKYYFSKVVPMGLVSACLCCQRTTSAIRHIMNNMGFYLCNYIDDMVSAEFQTVAHQSYDALGRLFRDLGVEESKEKAVEPTVEMEFVGNLLNTQNLTIAVTQARREELDIELSIWMCKRAATRRELESIIGKLQFVCNCIKAGRIFLNRLLNFLRGTKPGVRYLAPHQACKDIQWWISALQVSPSISIMWKERISAPNAVIAADACLTGAGGTFTPEGRQGHMEFYRCPFPEHVMQGTSIAILELWALILALKLWGGQLSGKMVVAHCDNEAVANLINSGKARDERLQAGLREVCFLAAKHEFEISARFWPGVLNRLPDLLSR